MPAGLSSTLIHFDPLLTTTSPCGQYFFFIPFKSACRLKPMNQGNPPTPATSEPPPGATLPGSARVSSVGDRVLAVTDFCWLQQSPFRRDAETNTRDACATQSAEDRDGLVN